MCAVTIARSLGVAGLGRALAHYLAVRCCRHRRPGALATLPRRRLKALVWFWLIDETLSANLVYQIDYEIGNTTPSDEAMMKIMTMVMAW